MCHWSEVKVAQSCPTLCNHMDYTVQGILQARILEKPLPLPSPGGLANPEIKPRSPALQVDSLAAEPPGKPKNTVVGSLSLFQWILWTQELNQGLLHCRWILYQLNYQESLLYVGHTTFNLIFLLCWSSGDEFFSFCISEKLCFTLKNSGKIYIKCIVLHIFKCTGQQC